MFNMLIYNIFKIVICNMLNNFFVIKCRRRLHLIPMQTNLNALDLRPVYIIIMIDNDVGESSDIEFAWTQAHTLLTYPIMDMKQDLTIVQLLHIESKPYSCVLSLSLSNYFCVIFCDCIWIAFCSIQERCCIY